MDHVEDYKMPKETGEEDELTQKLRKEGCAPSMTQAEEAEKEDAPLVKKSKKGVCENNT